MINRDKDKSKSRFMNRGGRSPIKFQVPEDAVLDYKNYTVLQKFLNERGKIIPRRITGLSAKRQRALASAVKRARFLGLLPTGGGLKI